MVEISPLTGSDHADWDGMVRAFNTHFGTEITDEGYARTWRRLVDRAEIRGIGARVDGRLVGLAHYYFHTSVWSTGTGCRCYVQDLFVRPEARRRGVGRALLEAVESDAVGSGAARMHWHTTEDNRAARALYDKVTGYRGFIAYGKELISG